jgi:hypothetical protein
MLRAVLYGSRNPKSSEENIVNKSVEIVSNIPSKKKSRNRDFEKDTLLRAHGDDV